MRLWIALAALFLFISCGEDIVTAPTPDPMPTPIPTAELCEIRGTRVTFERVDKGHAGDIVVAWPLGVVPLAHATPVYAGASEPEFDVDDCRAFDRVRWWCAGGVGCEFIGDQTSPSIFLKVRTPGIVCVRAQPLDLTEFGEACAAVQGPE